MTKEEYREIREQHLGLTRRDLAKLLKEAEATIESRERGANPIREKVAEDIQRLSPNDPRIVAIKSGLTPLQRGNRKHLAT